MKKWNEWYKLPNKELNELKKYPEFVMLRHNGDWRIGNFTGCGREIQLRTYHVTYDVHMAAIFSLLKQGWMAYVKPNTCRTLIIGFISPGAETGFHMVDPSKANW
ncbi:MAG: hypothetical protein HXS54_06260 [Theionarchaea archaeon]|nr:hypothetical protein [Theionarchaea archaeon]DBA34862.1 TPA_asm: hypothetical protein vir521_00068 [Caudoviricetes sp. vir521]